MLEIKIINIGDDVYISPILVTVVVWPAKKGKAPQTPQPIAPKKKSFLYLPHKNCLKENLTINENLESWFELTGLKVKYEDYQNKLKTFNLSNLQDKFINKLSHGQKKKVSLTKLLFSNTKLWLLDEPFNGIDIKSSDILKKIMHNHLMDGGSILFSSHLQSNIKLTKKVILKKVTNKLTSKSIDNWELL